MYIIFFFTSVQVPYGQLPLVDGAEPVHVLVRSDGVGDGGRVHRGRVVHVKGHLHDDAMHGGVSVQLGDAAKELGLGHAPDKKKEEIGICKKKNP